MKLSYSLKAPASVLYFKLIIRNYRTAYNASRRQILYRVFTKGKNITHYENLNFRLFLYKLFENKDQMLYNMLCLRCIVVIILTNLHIFSFQQKRFRVINCMLFRIMKLKNFDKDNKSKINVFNDIVNSCNFYSGYLIFIQ